MTEALTVTTERVDDIPLLLAQSERIGIADLLDSYFKPHGNWEGTSLGWTTVVWLTHLLSEGDHRMNQVQGWVAHRQQTLQVCTGQEVRERWWSDDRLALVLDALAQPEQWQRFETALLKAHQVQGLIRLQIDEQVRERRVRAYGTHPAAVRVERSFHLRSEVDQAAVSAATRRLGWRVYVTNHPEQTLTLEQAVLAYREEYLVERGFGRLKGKPLSLAPMYVQSDQRATGLIYLLSVALRILIILEGRCRQRLADQHESLPGLYAGNPKRTTSRPTAEALLQAFRLIHLSVVMLGQQAHRHLTPLSDLQQRILGLLDVSPAIYDRLGTQSPKPP